MASDNLYIESQPVYITDPSGRLGASGLNTVQFPYTPTISVITQSGYTSYDLSHTNFQQRAFEMASNTEFNMAAPIIIRSEEEAQSVLKMGQFFRGALKMNFGPRDPDAGLPPRVLCFYAHNIYTNVPILVRDFTWNLDQDVDYITLSSGERVRTTNICFIFNNNIFSKERKREFHNE